ncbi:CPBP family intramembrane metalloprotease [Bacillus thuringiensis]|nr:CPBP family intramembrane metalloprotease [Bacillus thuringiensis]
MGFVFSFVYFKTKRIVVPITAHALMNLVPVIALFNQ